jgi:hypothetical protein
MKITVFLFLSVLILIGCSHIQAQQKTSTQLTGRVFDLIGALIPGIKVVAYSQKKVEFEQWTNEDGVYTLDLPEGIYTLEVNSQTVKYNAFETVKFENYRIVPVYDGKINLDIPLPFIGDSILCILDISDSSEKLKQSKKNKTNKRKYKTNKSKEKLNLYRGKINK